MIHNPTKSIVIVAGEASGDLHGSHLVRALRDRLGPVFICGMGGRAMKKAGAKILIESDKVAVVGITEVLAKAPQVLKAMSRLKKLLAGLRPDLLILIDFPDFNLHLAAIARKLDIRVLYYISPQIWAWRANRVKKIKARVDHMAVILPFEKEFYEKHHVPVTFVGHPLMDALCNTPIRKPDGQLMRSPVIGLMPGSRDREVHSLLPIMVKAGLLLQEKMPSVRFVISRAPSIEMGVFEQLLQNHALRHVQISTAPVATLFPRCDLAVVASGTVTLEAAICGTPMIITYVVSPLSYWLGRALIDVAHIGLVNLIAGQRLVPELIQHQVTPEGICNQAFATLSDTDAYRQMCLGLQEVRNRLGASGASDEVARIASDLIEGAHAV